MCIRDRCATVIILFVITTSYTTFFIKLQIAITWRMYTSITPSPFAADPERRRLDIIDAVDNDRWRAISLEEPCVVFFSF